MASYDVSCFHPCEFKILKVSPSEVTKDQNRQISYSLILVITCHFQPEFVRLCHVLTSFGSFSKFAIQIQVTEFELTQNCLDSHRENNPEKEKVIVHP